MRKNYLVKIVSFLCVFTLVFNIFSCAKQEAETIAGPEVPKEPIIVEEELTEVEAPDISQGLITFISGDVFKLDAGEWIYVDIGELLGVDDSIKVDDDSYCEIQFGEKAVVRVQQNTELKVQNINLQEGETNVGLNMLSGSVLAKVEKLTGNETFKVRTPSTTCGVRGTEFKVQEDPEKGTVLAVQEGAVAVLPSKVDVDALKEKAELTGEEDILEVIKQIEANAPLVSANQEIEVAEADVAESAEALEKVEQVVEVIVEEVVKNDEAKAEKLAEIKKSEERAETFIAAQELAAAAEKSAEEIALEEQKAAEEAAVREAERQALLAQLAADKEALKAQLQARVETAVERVVEKEEKIQVISQENSDNLKEVEKMELVEIQVSRQVDKEADAAPPAPQLAKLSVVAQPSGAEILIAGEMVGRTRYQRLYEVGSNLSVVIRKEGYIEETLDVNLAEARGRALNVTLRKIPTPTKDISLRVSPADAKIILDNKEVASGTFNGTFDEGTELNFTVEKEGYLSQQYSINVSSSTPLSHSVALEEIPPNMLDITVSVSPANAKIFFDGEEIGVGKITKAFEEGTSISYRIEAEGYETETLDFVVQEANQSSFNVSLVELPPDTKGITISTVPQDALISIDGNRVGTGQYTDTWEEGQSFTVSVVRDGFETESRTISVTPSSPARYTIRLQAKPIENRIQSGNTSLVRSIGISGDIIVSADKDGVVTAVSADGRKLWSVQSENKPNENSSPVVSGNAVLFSGAREMLLLNVRNGSVIKRENLDGDSAHLFGRTAEIVGTNGYFPTNSGINIINVSSGAVTGSITIPGGSRMSPVVSGSDIFIADQSGNLLKMDVNSGSVKGQVASSAVQPIAHKPAVWQSNVYYAGRKGNLVAVNSSSMAVLWETPIGNKSTGVFTEPEVAQTGVYVFCKNGIYGYNPASGSPLFSGIENVSSPPAVIDNILYYGDSQGNLVLANPSSGRTLKTLRIGSNVTVKPVKVGNRIVVGTESGEVLIINPAGIQ